MLYRSLTALAVAATSLAIVTPTSPDGATVVRVGQDINALWTADPTGQWTDVEIQIMTGDNQAMVPLLTLGTGIDGTSATSFSYPAPEVSPYSKIYFLQFTLGGNVSTATWTTRFTIAGPNGETTEPTNTTTFDGHTVGWGSGALVNPPADPTTPNGQDSTGSSNLTTPISSSAPSASASIATSPVSSAMEDAVRSEATSPTSASSSTTPSAARAAQSSGGSMKGAQVGLGAVVIGITGFFWL